MTPANGSSRSKLVGYSRWVTTFDGTRTIAYVDKDKKSVRFLNRRGVWFEYRYPEMSELWKDVDAKRIILDGELVVLKQGKPDFYLLAEREHVEGMRAEMLSQIHPATYIVFDVLHLDGKDLIDLPLLERKEILRDKVRESERMLLSVYVKERGKAFFQKVKKKGLEGIMAKKMDSVYEIGRRSRNWLKIKCLETMDCVICGYTAGKGWREPYFGALLLGVYENGKLRYVGRVGTGWKEEDLKELRGMLERLKIRKNPFDIFEEEPAILEKTVFVKPRIVCEVKFLELTEDKKLRAPSFLRLREDKLPEECELELPRKPKH